MRSKNILVLGLLTLTLFPLLGFVIHYYSTSTPFLSIFKSHIGVPLELLIGSIVGGLGGLGGWWLISSRFMLPVREKYQDLIYSMKLNLPTIIIVSFCAGVGEEIFFRGVIQSYLGIWLTSIIFVTIHGYLSPNNWRISVYGSYMVILIALLGYMTQAFGLTSAMTAHTFIDIVLFFLLTNRPLRKHPTSSVEPLDQ